MTDHRVLVIDDEPTIGTVLETALVARGYDVEIAATGRAGLDVGSAIEPDLFIVDLGLPDLDGVEVTRQLRRWTTKPIIVLTVDDDIERKVEALDAGANDYVTKPFALPELLARIRVALRHAQEAVEGDPDGFVTVGRLQISPDAHVATVGDEVLDLTPKEFALITVLARNAGKVIPYRTLLVAVWGDAARHRMESLRGRVNQLRRKLERVRAAGVAVVTEPGVGYRLIADPTPDTGPE
jgi:two-component system KDP operon response regulator KdpE